VHRGREGGVKKGKGKGGGQIGEWREGKEDKAPN